LYTFLPYVNYLIFWCNRHHPDKVAEEERELAQKKFIKITEAYDVLMDIKKRNVYDQYGLEGVKLHEKGADPSFAKKSGSGGSQGTRSQGFYSGGQADGWDDFFNSAFYQRQRQEEQAFSNARKRAQKVHEEKKKQYEREQARRSQEQQYEGRQSNGQGGSRQYRQYRDRVNQEQEARARATREREDAFRNQESQRRRARAQNDEGAGYGETDVELYPVGGTTARMGKNKFPDENSKYVWLVHFYRNGSSSSVNIKRVLDLLKRNDLQETFKLGAVNCGLKKESSFCMNDLGLSEVPAIAIVANGKVTNFGQKAKDLKLHRTNEGLREFVKTNMPFELIAEIRTQFDVKKKLQDYVDKTLFCKHLSKKEGEKFKLSVVYLTDSSLPNPSLASIAQAYKNEINFGLMKRKDSYFQGIRNYPTFLAFVPTRCNTSFPFFLLEMWSISSQRLRITDWLDRTLKKVMATSEGQ